MKTVKVTFENDNTLTTDINGTDQEILDYYRVGKPFNIGDGPKDLISKVKSAELL